MIPELISLLRNLIEFVTAFLVPHLFSILGFILALLIIGRMILEKRQPSNIFTWSLLVFLVPVIGVPLYLVFGGRKSRRLAARKREIFQIADRIARQTGGEAKSSPGGGHFEKNNFFLLEDGVLTCRALLEEIKQAQTSINIMTYILGRDATGSRIVELLAERARDGLTVRLLMDGLGSFGSGRSFVQGIRDAGGSVARFMPVLPLQTHTSANLRNHRKIAIFDNERAIVGGQNLDNRFLDFEETNTLFLDFSAIIEGPVVSGLNQIFLTDWAYAAKVSPHEFEEIFAHRPPPSGDSSIEIIASGPDVEGDPLWSTVITMVQECRETITIITPYFIPDEVLFRSLMVKAHNGRKVKIILPEHSNHALADLARNHFIRQLHASGADIRFHQKGVVHAKLMIVDECALIGSANIDLRSLFVNFEIGLLHRTPGDVRAFQAWVGRVEADCLSFADTRRVKSTRPQRLAEDFAHLLIPLL